MTQEDKELLLKDLCARLPYGVKYLDTSYQSTAIFTALGIDKNYVITDEYYRFGNKYNTTNIENVKPYLRPMSSMTEEEVDEFTQFDVYSDGEYIMPNYETIDWLIVHHFDYRGLIPMGLAIAVTKENNPYKKIKL